MAARNYQALLARLRSIAGDRIETIGEFKWEGRTYPITMLMLGEDRPGRPRVMVDAGIHGDEPAGVEAALRFIERAVSDATLCSQFSFTIFPCNNPTGWELDTRENARGVDLNRGFVSRQPELEVEIIQGALQGRCFDLVFEMHEDVDSPGLYLYELACDADDHVGEKIVAAAESMGCPINTNDCIEGLSAYNGVIRRRVIRFRKTRVPLAIYAYRTCGGHVITLEPPASVISFEDRVRVELAALEIALGGLAKDTSSSGNKLITEQLNNGSTGVP